MIRVLFTDCDGVINRCGVYAGMEEDKLNLVRWIIYKTGCLLVVSSMWRQFPNLMERLRKELPIHDVTPVLPDPDGDGFYSNRGLEIESWLSNHPEVERYVIVDDNALILEHQLLWFVETESFVGLTPELASEIINKLNS